MKTFLFLILVSTAIHAEPFTSCIGGQVEVSSEFLREYRENHVCKAKADLCFKIDGEMLCFDWDPATRRLERVSDPTRMKPGTGL